ncbi:hypothetical protein K438DRAFT_1945831 [Mycena galopus ATCC 62051]|nr:hypothetical protein K438DRAFT_1945831 [Mycena galopus ATCC 62051]
MTSWHPLAETSAQRSPISCASKPSGSESHSGNQSHFLMDKTRSFSRAKSISYGRWYSVQTTDKGDTRCLLKPTSRGPPSHLISTLNPASLVSGDYLDIPERIQLLVRFPKTPNNTPSRIRNENAYPILLPFPPQCTGFLYYHRDRDAAPLEGSIRFRITSGRAPSSFHRGHDLLLSSGLPWQIILPQIGGCTMYAGFREQLLQENLATTEQFSQCLDTFRDRKAIRPELILFRLNQHFPVNFSSRAALTIVGEALYSFPLSSLFRTQGGRPGPGFYYLPWAGTGLARFEPSIAPHNRGRRVINLRITEIHTPISSTRTGDSRKILKPEEGQLLTYSRYGRAPEPWAYDIDAKDTALALVLRILWDNSRIP